MSTFKDLISKIATPVADDENPVSEEDIQDAIAEVTAKDEEIQSLKTQLEEMSKAYEDLKNRVLDNLFSNAKGKAEEPEDVNPNDQEQEVKRKSFDDIINPQYKIKN